MKQYSRGLKGNLKAYPDTVHDCFTKLTVKWCQILSTAPSRGNFSSNCCL